METKLGLVGGWTVTSPKQMFCIHTSWELSCFKLLFDCCCCCCCNSCSCRVLL